MAPFTERPKQMVGLHFFNPVQLMALVEVVKTEQTDPAVFARAYAFAEALGKTPIECIDTPGFVVNRLLVPYICESLQMLERGVASPSDIDTAMRLGAGHPMGPIHLADYIGLDTIHNITKGWHEMDPDTFPMPALLASKARTPRAQPPPPRVPLLGSASRPCTVAARASRMAAAARQIPPPPPPPATASQVAEGKLGRKTGEGFYKWDGDKLAQ